MHVTNKVQVKTFSFLHLGFPKLILLQLKNIIKITTSIYNNKSRFESLFSELNATELGQNIILLKVE